MDNVQNCNGYVITGHTQKNGSVSKVITKFISHPTGPQLTLSAVETVKVFSALILILISYFPSVTRFWNTYQAAFVNRTTVVLNTICTFRTMCEHLLH
jgi:hypothetical protein